MNEITVVDQIAVSKNGFAGSMAKSVQVTLAGGNPIHREQAISQAGTALDVTGLGTLGRYAMCNNDDTLTITIYDAISGHAIQYLLPGEPCSGRFPAGVTAPYAVASASSPPASPPETARLEYFICED